METFTVQLSKTCTFTASVEITAISSDQADREAERLVDVLNFGVMKALNIIPESITNLGQLAQSVEGAWELDREDIELEGVEPGGL